MQQEAVGEANLNKIGWSPTDSRMQYAASGLWHDGDHKMGELDYAQLSN